MKTKYIVAALACALLTLTSCIQDLETLPLNPWDTTSETAYGKDRTAYVQGLAKLYFNFTSNDTTDLLVSDAGASELIRSFWSCQEVSTDEVKCAWGDAWAEAINTNMYDDSENDMVYGVFVRTLQGISYINEYLRQTADDKLDSRGVDAALKAEIQGFRAEARFLRAYFYWMAMDIFGDVPFTDENSVFGSVNPKQKPRKDVYAFIVSELEELASEGSAMPEAASNRPRADKGAVLGLLARVYLNAEVYTGTPAWEECKDACERIYALGKYNLATNYASLFRGDNGENPDAYNEFLFSAYYDETSAQSWGGATYLTCGAANSNEVLGETNILHKKEKLAYSKKAFREGDSIYFNDNGDKYIVRPIYNDKGELTSRDTIAFRDDLYRPGDEIAIDENSGDSIILRPVYKMTSRLGIGNGWLGLHVHEHFVNTHFKPENVTWDDTESKYTDEGASGSAFIKDVRGHVFHTARRTQGDFAELQNTFMQGWGCWKFNNIPHNESDLEFWERTGSLDKVTNIDYPLIRLGEIHLIYAEACVRLGQGATAQAKVNELAARAGVALENYPAAWSDEAMKWFREERARELFWEGHRRTDLIRYNSYCEDSYLWPFKGGDAKTGKAFPEYKKLFAIPVSQLLANPELKNPVGY